MISDGLFFTYLGVIILAIASGFYKLKEIDAASKILLLLLCLTLASEIASHWAALLFNNNMFVYHIFAPIQLILVGIYFDNILPSFKKKKIATIIGIIASITAVVNTVFFQPLKILNSNFLLLEGIIIIALALYTFQLILTNESINIFQYGHFWMVVIFIFFWSVTYTTWALYSVLGVKKLFVIPYVSYTLWLVNIITYAAIGFVLIYFPGRQKQLAHE